MKKWLIKKSQERLKRYIRTRYEIIKPIPTQGLFNYKCHLNAVEYSRTHTCGVVETIYIDHYGEPILHYLNVDSNGQHLETTFGWQADLCEYYKIREINPDDYKNIVDEFNWSLESWCEQFVGWFGRKVLRIDRIT